MKNFDKIPTDSDQNLDIKEIVSCVQQIHIQAAESYLSEDDSLRQYIIDYYSDAERLELELSFFLTNKSKEEVNDVISTYEERAANKTLFIETFQRIRERTALFQRAKRRSEEQPLATEEEYQMGIYSEQLESQVREAVSILFKKGYKTFESGFVESDIRSQYIGMYNLTIEIPYSVSEALSNLGFIVESRKMEDRTKIFIRPTKDEPVRLEEWKDVWNTFADLMPVSKNEDLSGLKIYNQHGEFRQRQNQLRKHT